ncbi:hypothetical protein, unlikely [Trypanosoma brucei brucei TREU927]|uniref:Uncharacterized protein n=1 Tax=Trypanosoma brucei brucei (strain 927/4 GUTat10.1) TaxID=185431 RepID=Q38ES5_TRYB2|nr:hypothetical protein, unlikely [Trypanosoma brucei brucei TREU927]EAN76695.1 hypothetical protein, unlikely [Trypanosoma brucei brucei TREU927]
MRLDIKSKRIKQKGKLRSRRALFKAQLCFLLQGYVCASFDFFFCMPFYARSPTSVIIKKQRFASLVIDNFPSLFVFPFLYWLRSPNFRYPKVSLKHQLHSSRSCETF